MDFESDEAFEAWLRAQSRDLCVMIAVRAAMRVWPILERSGLQGKAEIAILGAGRALMAAALPKGPKVPGLPPADAAIPRHDACGPAYDAIATAALVTNTSGAEKRASLTRQAVHQAAEARAMTVSVRAIPITAEQAREPVRARSKALAYLDADKSVDELRSATLGGGSNMDLGHDPLSVHDKSFAFWSRWFDAAERGAPLDFELQRRIVTEIPDDVWSGEDAPRRVAQEIARIEKQVDAIGTEAKVVEDSPRQRNDDAIRSLHATKIRADANRDALVLMLAELEVQLTEFQERVRGSNQLSPEKRSDLLDLLQGFLNAARGMMSALPEPGAKLGDEAAGRLCLWLNEYQRLIREKAASYLSPRSLADATVPTGIVLLGTAVGAILGSPVAGSVVSGLIVQQVKPGQAAQKLLEGEPWERSEIPKQ